jgi:uroporphyrin-III C-methyltransferase
MRGVNKAVILATGHAAQASDELDWAALARTGQPIVVYMGMNNLGRIAAALLQGGLAPETPAAVLMAATTPKRRLLVADLGSIEVRAVEAGIRSPALIVVGGIVALRARLLAGSAT